MKPETRFKTQVQAKLKRVPRSFWVKVQMIAVRGIPDILGVVGGRFVALELKVGKNRADPLQKYAIEAIRNAGGYALVVTPENFQEVLADLHRLAEEP